MRRSTRYALNALAILSLLLFLATWLLHGSRVGTTETLIQEPDWVVAGIVLVRTPLRHIFDDLFPALMSIWAIVPLLRAYSFVRYSKGLQEMIRTHRRPLITMIAALVAVKSLVSPLPANAQADPGASSASAPEAPDPNSFQGLFATGRKLAAAGDHRGALAKYDAALALSKDDANIIAYKAMSHAALGQAKEAQQEIDQALRLNDKEYTFWQIAGQVKAAQNQFPQARALFDKAAQLSPKDAGAIYLDLAAVLAAKNDDKLAGDIESSLKAATAAEPPSAEALFQLGQSYANVGKQEGRAYLQRFLNVAGKLPEPAQDKTKMQVARQLIKALDALKQVVP